MRDRNFVWDPGTFKILGINFSTNLSDIVRLNFSDKLDELKRDIAKWKRRPLSPLGKITLIKTLFVSKLTYLFLNLPDPQDDFLKEYEHTLMHFLWGSKTSKIKKQTVINSYEEGGLKMYDIYTSLSVLKISWLRRLEQAEDPSLPSADIYPALRKIKRYGDDFARSLLKNMDNSFWRDVVKHYLKLSDKYKPTCINEYAKEPIFYNSKIKRGGTTVFIAEWDEQNVTNIGDITDIHGNLLSYQDFREKYQGLARTNFLLYQGICTSIRKNYPREIINRQEDDNNRSKGLWFAIMNSNISIKSILNGSPGTPTAVLKWNILYPNINWKNIFKLCFHTTKDTTLQWFQARLLHRILPTAKYLKLCKISNSDLCTFCNENVETLEHLYWECGIVKVFWEEFTICLKEKCYNCARLTLNLNLILFGVSQNIRTDKPFDFILLYAKFYIYKCKLKNTLPYFETYLQQLKARINVEERSYKNNTTLWYPYKNLFIS